MNAEQERPQVLAGSCLCGAVRIRMAQPVRVTYCHCRECRKTAGAPFQAVAAVATNDCTIEAAPGIIAGFRASPGKVRAFCSVCGSPLYSRRDGSDETRLRAGLFAELGDVREQAHIFVDDGACWETPARDDLPRHAGLEPARRNPAAGSRS